MAKMHITNQRFTNALFEIVVLSQFMKIAFPFVILDAMLLDSVCVCKYIISFQMHQIRCELKFKSTEIYKEYNRSSSEVCWERERGGERNSFPLHCCNCINCNDLYAKKGYSFQSCLHFLCICIGFRREI